MSHLFKEACWEISKTRIASGSRSQPEHKLCRQLSTVRVSADRHTEPTFCSFGGLGPASPTCIH